jgi:hypothetical protein
LKAIDPKKFESDTLQNFADAIISNKHESVTSQMAAVFNMVIGTPSSSGHNFIDLFMQSLEVIFKYTNLTTTRLDICQYLF